MEALGWLILIVVMIIIEGLTLSLATIWFAGGGVVALVASLLGAPVIVQWILFLGVSIVLLIFTRPFALKYVNKGRIKTNVDAIIGSMGIVQESVNNLKGKGKVMLNGIEWTARTKDDQTTIEAGRVVTVLEVRGVTAIVEEKMEDK